MRYQLALNKTFCPTPPPFTHRQFKHRQRTNINKTMLSASHHRFSTQSSQCQYWKANKYSILTVIELGPPVLESSAGSQNYMSFFDFEHKLNKTEIENWLPIGFNLALKTITLCIPIHRGFIYPSTKSWNDPGDISLPWNCASVIKSHSQNSE